MTASTYESVKRAYSLYTELFCLSSLSFHNLIGSVIECSLVSFARVGFIIYCFLYVCRVESSNEVGLMFVRLESLNVVAKSQILTSCMTAEKWSRSDLG